MSNVIAFRPVNQPAPDEELLIEQYRFLVINAARRMLRVNPRLHAETLVADGLYGLMQAVRRFDPTNGVKFSSFADPYITGRMIDGIRRDHVEASRFVASPAELAADSARMERDASIAAAIDATPAAGCSSSEVRKGRYRRMQFIGLHELVHEPAAVEPAGVDVFTFQRIQRILSGLGDTEQQVIQLLYFDGLSVAEASARLNLSAWVVSRIHGKVLDKLRRSLLPTDGQRILRRVA
jgi:RNA polymerase sigma factor FliA